MANSKKDKLKNYLKDQLSNGTYYLKSRDVADDIDLTSKQVGTLFRKMSNSENDIDISKWAGDSKATTWRISES